MRLQAVVLVLLLVPASSAAAWQGVIPGAHGLLLEVTDAPRIAVDATMIWRGGTAAVSIHFFDMDMNFAGGITGIMLDGSSQLIVEDRQMGVNESVNPRGESFSRPRVGFNTPFCHSACRVLIWSAGTAQAVEYAISFENGGNVTPVSGNITTILADGRSVPAEQEVFVNAPGAQATYQRGGSIAFEAIGRLHGAIAHRNPSQPPFHDDMTMTAPGGDTITCPCFFDRPEDSAPGHYTVHRNATRLDSRPIPLLVHLADIRLD